MRHFMTRRGLARGRMISPTLFPTAPTIERVQPSTVWRRAVQRHPSRRRFVHRTIREQLVAEHLATLLVGEAAEHPSRIYGSMPIGRRSYAPPLL